MKISPTEPPRVFTVGFNQDVRMKDCGRVELEPDEQVTFITPDGAEYDLACKSWGFYATPSLNHRLKRFGLRGVLVENRLGHRFILLVENEYRPAFDRYLDDERLRIISWLDSPEPLEFKAAGLEAEGENDRDGPLTACLCGRRELIEVHAYPAPPPGEVRFEFSEGGPYRREIVRCQVCGHYLSRHRMSMERLYGGDYVTSTYGDLAGIKRAFERINALPPERSDNLGRVRRVVEYARAIGIDPVSGGLARLLDVGAGLGVFPYRMKEAGWQVTAVDTDSRLVAHLRTVVGVEAVCSTIQTAVGLGQFEAVSLNKVLEHVADPVSLLRDALSFLTADGFVYLEVPDGEGALGDADGFNREEFFIEHHHIFTPASLDIMARQAGANLRRLESLREPSGKYTLYAFLRPGRPRWGRP